MTDEERREKDRARNGFRRPLTEEQKEARRQYARNHRAKVKAEDPEKYREMLDAAHKWTREHPEKEREYARRKYQRHKTKIQEKNSLWFKENPDRARELSRAHYWKDPDKSRAQVTRRAHRLYITDEQWEGILLRLKGPCDICGVSAKRMHVDHDHKKLVFRGVLCHSCNISLGHFRDDPALLRKAADYLERA